MSANALSFSIEWIDVTVSCDRHGEHTVKRMKSFGGKVVPDAEVPDCPLCAKERAAIHAREEAEKKRAEHAAKLLKAAGLPLRFSGCSFDDYTANTVAQARALDLCRRYADSVAQKKRSGWLVFTGNVGTGKTMLLACMARALAEAHIASLYTTQAAMGREFRATYQRNSEVSEATLFDEYTKTPVLLLDELAAASTEGTDRVIFEVLDARYGDARPTVIATNHPRGRLKDVLGERLADRLREEATFLAFDWESSRKPAGLKNKPKAPKQPETKQGSES